MKTRNVSAFIFMLLPLLAWATPESLTYQGRIKNSQGDPLEVNGVRFEFTIMNPGGTCILYRETSNAIDMRNSSGVFDVPIGTGTKNYPTSSSFKLLDSFDNNTTLLCEGGGTYPPVADAKRLLRVQFHDGTGWRLITPDNEIRSVPYAGHAQTAQSAQRLGTNIASDFVVKSSLPLCTAGQYLRHIAPAGTFVCTTPTVNGTDVTGNISGSAAGFTGNLSGDVTGTQSFTSVDKIKGVAVDMTGLGTGKVLKYDGGKWVPADDMGTSGALTGLTGDVSSSGAPSATVTLNDNVVTSAKIVDGTIVNADIAAGAAITDSKLATLTTAGKVSGNAIISGTIGGSTAINTSGLIQTSTGLRVYSGSNYVELKAPTLSQNTSYELPFSDGSTGQLLTTDGGGKLSWTTITTSGGTVTGVTASAPLVSSGGTAPVISLNNSGVAAGTYDRVTVTAKGLVTGGSNVTATDLPNLAGDVTSTAGLSNSKVEKIQGIPVASTTPSLGQILMFDSSKWNVQYFGFGELRSTVTGNTQMPASCATANKTLNWSAITDTFTCANIAIANTQVSGLGTASTKDFGDSAGNLVELDGSGKIPAALLPASGDNLGNHTATTNLNMGTYNITNAGKIYLADGAWNTPSLSFASSPSTGISNSGGIMKFTSGGNLAMDLSATSLILNGSFGPLMRLGGGSFTAANPTYSFGGYSSSGMFPGTGMLGFSVNGTERLRMDSNGMIGVGTTSPTRRLHIVGDGTDYGDDIFMEGVNSETAVPQISLVRSRGTASTRNPILANDTIGTLAFRGYDNSTHAYSARISSNAETDFATAVNGNLRFYTAAAGTDAERMRITGSGNVGIGTTSPLSTLHIKSNEADVVMDGTNPFVVQRSTAYPTASMEVAGIGYRSESPTPSTNLWPPQANVSFRATENHTASAQGTGLSISTTANGSTTRQERVKIDGAGDVTVMGKLIGAVKDTSGNSLRACVGSSSPGGWTYYAVNTTGGTWCSAYKDISTSSCNFSTVFNYFPTLDASVGSHWVTFGATSVYNITPTSFRIYIGILGSYDSTNCNASAVPHNSYGYYIRWMGVGL